MIVYTNFIGKLLQGDIMVAGYTVKMFFLFFFCLGCQAINREKIHK